MVRAAARLHANQARRQIHKELEHLMSLQPILQRHLAAFIDAVLLKIERCSARASKLFNASRALTRRFSVNS